MAVSVTETDVLTDAGLYMLGYFIQLSKRDFVSRETAEVTTKYYVMVAAGNSTRGGAVNVGVSEKEYSALEEKDLQPGSMILAPVEAFGFKDKAYFRATGPVSAVSPGDA